MADWTPIFALPNLDCRATAECEFAAIVSRADPRAQKLCADHPPLADFLARFSSQFGNQVWPTLLLVRADAPKSTFTPEAVTGLRDILSMSVVPYARARRLWNDHRSGFIFSTAFQLYPWMLDAKYENILMVNSAEMHLHVVEEFQGQTFSEQSPQTLSDGDVDMPLADELLKRWTARFIQAGSDWQAKALFRSLNMANEAASVPAPTAATFFDVGRSLALWVSAYEIVAHPGGTGQSNFVTVTSLLDAVSWFEAGLRAPNYQVGNNPQNLRTLPVWICKKIYDLRNDFLHGNEVDGPALMLNSKPIIDFAACIYRAALTGFLDLKFKQVAPDQGDLAATIEFVRQRRRFNHHQEMFERALLRAI